MAVRGVAAMARLGRSRQGTVRLGAAAMAWFCREWIARLVTARPSKPGLASPGQVWAARPEGKARLTGARAARRGSALRGNARQSRPGMARSRGHGTSGPFRRDEARRGQYGEVWRGSSWPEGKARPGLSRTGEARLVPHGLPWRGEVRLGWCRMTWAGREKHGRPGVVLQGQRGQARRGGLRPGRCVIPRRRLF